MGEPPFPLAGELASLGAALIWSCSMSVFTVCGRHVPAQALNLFKNLVAVTCLTALSLFLPWPRGTEPTTYAVLAASGVVGLSLGDTALFFALRRLGAQVTSAAQCLAPPIAALIAAVTLGESLSSRELAGLMVTAGAVAALVYFGKRGGAHLADLPGRTLAIGLAFALVAATCQAAGIVLQRYAMQRVDVVHGTLTRILPAILVLAGMTFATSGGPPVKLRSVFLKRREGLLLTAAAFGGTFLGLILMATGAKYTKAGIAAALTSTYPIWIVPIARFVLKERVTWQGTLCTVIAVGGIILMVT